MLLAGINSVKILTAFVSLLVSSEVSSAAKIDCHPLEGASKERCESLGCLWAPVEKRPTKPEPFGQTLPGTDVTEPRVNEPWCYFPDDYVGYTVAEISASRDRYKLVRKRPSGVPNDTQLLIMELEDLGQAVRIKIFDATRGRFEPEIPELELEPLAGEKGAAKTAPQFEVTVDELGQLTVKRRATGAVVFDTDLRKLIFADKFLQLNSKLGSPFVYGLGEHYDTFLKMADSYKVYSFFHTDCLPLPGGQRSYGSFPFYVNLDSAGKQAHGVYLRNANAMDVVLQPDASVTFRPIGGILDFIIFSGPRPLDVVGQFQRAIGLPELPPRWALGFHLCRYNYNSLDKTRLVWRRTREAGIPFDVQWNDIDYMDRHNDFTYDRDKFAGLPDFVEELHAAGMHYVLLFDPGLPQDDAYEPYRLGKLMDVFVKNATNETLVGKVWNDLGRTVFPDFSNNKSVELWARLFVDFQKVVKFDGAWIDMNDISNFVDGSLDGCPPDNQWESPPYRPGGFQLQSHSLCLSAKHRAGNEYDVHNLYSFYEAIATRKALAAARPSNRSLIISRSTTVGQGHYGGHWSGDVLSNWDYLKWSIPSLIEHSMYGYSMMGSDICGFGGDTTPQLCARWSTLGAFYTFSRNHNDDRSIDQDPVALGDTVVAANRNAYRKKYSLLPYFYTLLHRAHRFGEPVIRSVAFEAFGELESGASDALKVEYQFFVGRGLMVSPIVDEDTYEKRTYLPRGRWFESDLLPSTSQSPHRLKGDDAPRAVPRLIESQGEWYTSKNVGLANMPLFYRASSILPIYPDAKQTTGETAKQPFGLQVALCAMARAMGELFEDDGESLDDNRYNHLEMRFAENVLNVTMTKDDYSPKQSFGEVIILGMSSQISGVKILSDGGKEIPFKQDQHMVRFNLGGASVYKNHDLVVKCY